MELKKILVLRFSAMGDVALLVPVIKSLVEVHRDVEVTVATRPKFAPFFFGLERVIVFPADVDQTYRGIFGLWKMFWTLKRTRRFDAVIDVHDHLRTMVISALFWVFGIPAFVFKKGRSEKKKFTRKNNKITTPLLHTVERYRLAFENGGFHLNIHPPPYFMGGMSKIVFERFGQKKTKWMGIAPFAKHATKIWPLENYPLMIEALLQKVEVKFFLFGGGEEEVAYFEELKKRFPENCEIVARQLQLKEELDLLPHIDLMLCVDSANMHLAALAAVPLLSIWGGTHPDVGFGPFGKNESSVIQISREELPCRPCSVYGKETCFRGDFACMRRIGVGQVVDRILQVIR